jgi:radical SAM enzyme (TIGR01210 family)
MCPFTNENNYGFTSNPHALLEQVSDAITRKPGEPDYEVLALYNDGSFFAPKEISADTQLKIAALVARSGVRRLVVESLPQFIVAKTMVPFVAALQGIELEVGIGLQSSDDLVRETLVNTRVTRASFEAALAVMTELGVFPKIYLMIKPPFLTDEEAITDVTQSVRYVRSLGIHGITLCPTRVSRNTVAWRLWESGHYQPPNLWTVVDIVREAHLTSQVRVACINLRGSDFESIFPDSCPVCADRVVDGLVRYSETGNLDDLPQRCNCRPTNVAVPLDHSAVVARGLEALSTLADGAGTVPR